MVDALLVFLELSMNRDHRRLKYAVQPRVNPLNSQYRGIGRERMIYSFFCQKSELSIFASLYLNTCIDSGENGRTHRRLWFFRSFVDVRGLNTSREPLVHDSN